MFDGGRAVKLDGACAAALASAIQRGFGMSSPSAEPTPFCYNTGSKPAETALALYAALTIVSSKETRLFFDLLPSWTAQRG